MFSTSTEIVRVPADEVVFISASGNYCSIKTSDGGEYVLTIQLGQMESRIAEMLEPDDNRFLRIGKSLIVNLDFITFINPARQRMILSDCRSFRHELSASKEALKAVKEHLEKED